ncbi:OmpA family protein [Sphaerisporangium fuscum]|uniref:OmpA family protein n=1 Tax=Sphaerisporangium fuscum TaxID=2835868 RepID=UPI001BDD3513|nr:OmpA family protein [Sphaerisporangium fuscum]
MRATRRLLRVAAEIQAESAGGAVRVEGHTDDQGTGAYTDALSLRRAQAVREALQSRLPGVTLQVRGFGERRPQLPDIMDGHPVKRNQARNRRVEIIFDARK